MDRSRSAALAVCQKFFESRTVQSLLRVGKPERFTKVFDGHMTLPVLEPLMRVHNFAFIGS